MSVIDQGDHSVAVPDENGLFAIAQTDASSELDEFVYIISHDLRNSARALSEVPSWLREDMVQMGVQSNADVTDNLDLLERHARRLDRMLLDLLVYSRVGRLQQVSEIDLNSLLGDIQDENPLAAHMSLKIETPLPQVCMGYKDAYTLFKCVLDNVERHCGPDPVTLTVSGQGAQDTVTLVFTDDGPGVPDSKIQRIFRPMRTLRRRDEVEGSGMGLTIVHKIAQFYNGSLHAGAGDAGRGLRLKVQLQHADGPDVGL